MSKNEQISNSKSKKSLFEFFKKGSELEEKIEKKANREPKKLPLWKSLVHMFVLAFVLNLAIETLARKWFNGILFMVHSPVVFFYNVILIFATLSIALLFKRRMFFTMLVSGIWMAIGIANGIILMERMTPFTVKDLSAINDAATILTNYFNTAQLIGIAAGIVITAIAIVLLWILSPKYLVKGQIKKNIIAVLLIIISTFGLSVGLIKTNVLATFFGNLAYAYSDYGVPYCFVNTWLNTGIQKPENYSEEEIRRIVKKYDLGDGKDYVTFKKTNTDKKHPNILFLQLESFTDPLLFKNIKLSRDPIPNFRKYMKEYSSGSLTVPACGAGTANTEFESMTGMSVKFFGPGEYPFKSILKNKKAESVATDLKYMGYGTHAIHNHRALFYNRNKVFDNIGYDTFTSVEYMSDVPKTPKNWAKDEILTRQIMDSLKSTKSRDYVYTISVQGHGKYPSEQLIRNPKIKVVKAPNEETKWKYEYYVNQLYEMDQFIKQLTEQLKKFKEPTILVMYGDHIPALDISEDSYNAKNLYQTQYIVWDNMNLKKKDGPMKAYELTPEVLNRVGIHQGTIMKYTQRAHKSPNYLKDLKMLSYDMLYGQQYVYGGKDPFVNHHMKMGVKKIKIDKVVKVGGKYYIKGQNFTEYSKITLKGETLKTIYLSPNLLGLLEEVDPNKAKEMKVSQIDKNKKEIISSTE